jgi:SpoVK/Ycf46/Vps4 family AAA+-type ATPase
MSSSRKKSTPKVINNDPDISYPDLGISSQTSKAKAGKSVKEVADNLERQILQYFNAAKRETSNVNALLDYTMCGALVVSLRELGVSEAKSDEIGNLQTFEAIIARNVDKYREFVSNGASGSGEDSLSSSNSGGDGNFDDSSPNAAGGECTVKPVIFTKGSKDCNYWFDTVFGLDEAKRLMRNGLISPLKYPKLFGESLTKGILLYGVGGTGKTSIVKAAVNQLQVEDPSVKVLFFAPTGADLKGKYVGESEKRISSLYSCASRMACKMTKKSMRTTQSSKGLGRNPSNNLNNNSNDLSAVSPVNSPVITYISVIFIDEVEAVAGDRSKDESGIMKTTVNSLLQAIDGINSYPNVVTIAVTNLPQDLDQAFLRRFTNTIYIDVPEATTIKTMLESLLSRYMRSNGKNPIEIYCKAIGGSDGSGASVTALKPKQSDESCGQLPQEDVTAWKRFPYAEYIKGLTDSDLAVISGTCFKGKYSNSDIDRVFKYASQLAAEDAVQTNTFLKIENLNSSGKEKEYIYVSTLTQTKAEMLKLVKSVRGKTALRILEKPETSFINLIIDDKPTRFVSSSMLPLLNIADPNIDEVFYEDNITHLKAGLISETIRLLLKFRILITQKPEEEYNETRGIEMMKKNFLSALNSSAKNPHNLTLASLQGIKKWELAQSPEINALANQLTYPGLAREEVFYTVCEVDLSSGLFASFQNGLSKYYTGFKYWLTSESFDGAKFDDQISSSKFLKETTLYKLLSNTTHITTEWSEKEKTAFVYKLPFKDSDRYITRANWANSILGLVLKKNLVTKLPIFHPGCNIVEMMRDISKVSLDVKPTQSPFSATSFSILDYVTYAFLGVKLGEIPSQIGKFADDITQVNDLITEDTVNDIVKGSNEVRFTGGINNPRLSHLISYLREMIQDLIDPSIIRRNSINLNISMNYFKTALEEVKSSVNVNDLEKLRQYSINPQKFLADKK